VTPELLDALYKEADESAPKADEAPAGAVSANATQAPAEAVTAEATEAPAEAAAPVAASYTSDAPEGHEVGQQLPDFTVTCLDGSTFHLAEQRGKITFINFWATYCTPCVQELPHFDALYRAHEGDIAMVAVHAAFASKDPKEYLADKGYVFPFAHDADGSLMELTGGNGTMPQTVVLNRKGEVIYNKSGSVTPELLDALYKQADQ
jgi:thiol-disulfide isomerase/thioredoxin